MFEMISPIFEDYSCEGFGCLFRNPIREEHFIELLVHFDKTELFIFDGFDFTIFAIASRRSGRSGRSRRSLWSIDVNN